MSVRRPVAATESLPALLLPLLAWHREEPDAPLFFIERGGLVARDAYCTLCAALGVSGGELRTGMIRRPCTTRGDMGVVLRQLLSPREARRALRPHHAARVAAACIERETARALRDAGSAPLAHVLGVLASDYRAGALVLLHTLHQLLIAPSGPLQTAATRLRATGCDEVLAQIDTVPELARDRFRLRAGLRRCTIDGSALQRQLRDRTVAPDDIAQATAGLFDRAIDECRFVESDALRVALEDSSLEQALAAGPIFVDDAVGSGETMIAASAIQALYANRRPPRFFALCAAYPAAARSWQVALRIATDSAVVPEDRPHLLDGYWSYADDRYVRNPFARSDAKGARPRAFTAGGIKAILSAAHRTHWPPDGFDRLPPPTRARCVEAVLLRRHFRQRRGFCEAFEAELDHAISAANDSGAYLQSSGPAVAQYLAWLDAAVPRRDALDLDDIACGIVTRACRRWTRERTRHFEQQRRWTDRWLADRRSRSAVLEYAQGAVASAGERFCDDSPSFRRLLASCGVAQRR